MIYLDNNATTQIAPEVLDAMMPFLSASYGNPSSAHSIGREAKKAVDRARESVAALIGARHPSEIAFTSGGTESDNWAILGALRAYPRKKHMITTCVEHEAVRKLCDKVETRAHRVTRLVVDETGALDLDAFRAALDKDTALVSVMLANNETGIIFPVAEIARFVKEHSDAYVHVDGVNAVGKIPVNLKETEIDLFSFSGHKFYAPKGIGALYIRDGIEIPEFLTGGGQEGGRRPGTEAVHQIAGIGAAADLVQDMSQMTNIRALRDRLENEILNKCPNSRLNGTGLSAKRLPNTTNISFENTNGEAILAKLNDLEVYVSTGSACSSKDHTASPVLQAMNIPYSRAMGSIRFSFGRFNSDEEVSFVLGVLPGIIAELRALAA